MGGGREAAWLGWPIVLGSFVHRLARRGDAGGRGWRQSERAGGWEKRRAPNKNVKRDSPPRASFSYVRRA